MPRFPQAMAQISLRNPKAVALVERLAERTGKSKTAVLLAALEAYGADTAGADVDEVLASPEHEGHAPHPSRAPGPPTESRRARV